MVFLQFVPFLFIALVANLGERYRQWRWVPYALLVLTNLLVLLSALLLLLAQLALELSEMPLDWPVEPDWDLAALILALTGVLGFGPLLRGMRRFLARWLDIDPHSCLHTTALVFAVYLVGLVLAQLPLVGGLEGLEETGLSVGQLDLWAQALAFLLLALIGVGLGVRRSPREAAARLGLRWPSWRAWLGGIGLVILLEALDYGMAVGWQALDPTSYERIGRISKQLFGGLLTPWGALAVGVTAGVGEEMLFRGAVQPRFGLLLTSLLFAVGHIQYGFSPALLEILVIGLILGWLRRRWGLVVCIAVHAAYNFLNLLLVPWWP